MSDAFPLDAYLERIGLKHLPLADSQGLIEVTRAQARQIVFENLDPYLGRPVFLDRDRLLGKLIHRRRGGYCFELNSVLQMALETLGFTTSFHLARVANEEGIPDRRSHLLLQVDIQGRKWLADCGFGRGGPRYALPMETGRLEVQDGEAYRLMEGGDDGLILHYRRQGWQSLYGFGTGGFRSVDIEMANYYTSTWPDQRFRTELIAARTTAQGRCTLSNTRFRELGASEVSEIELETAKDVRRVLVQSFGLPEAEIDEPILAQRLGCA